MLVTRIPLRFFMILMLLFLAFIRLFAQDSLFIRVHFLHGSKPDKNALNEPVWFGGLHGGHVGIEFQENQIINFLPSGSFHLFKKLGSHRTGQFTISSAEDFYSMLGGGSDSIKRTIVVIPVSLSQMIILDSLITQYCRRSPYDYAFFGMRCGSAAYDILARMGILPRYDTQQTIFRIFYPKLLRQRLLKEASLHHWQVIRQHGTTRRIWEGD